MGHRRSKAVKNWLIYRSLLAATSAASLISLPNARRIGRSIGWLADHLLGREIRKAHASIAIAFPDLSAKERRRLITAMFRHLGTSALEIAWMQKGDRQTFLEHTQFEGVENLREPIESGRGVVTFTGHCGNWEWLGGAVALSGFPINVVAREIFDPRLNEFIAKSRALYGIRTIGRGSATSAKDMLQTLKSGQILAALIDQNIRAENAMVPFFGRPAATPIGLAKIAIRSGAACIGIFIERRGDMQVVRFEEPILTKRDDDPVEITARMTLAIEQQIRRVPEQWVWMHERWKERQ